MIIRRFRTDRLSYSVVFIAQVQLLLAKRRSSLRSLDDNNTAGKYMKTQLVLVKQPEKGGFKHCVKGAQNYYIAVEMRYQYNVQVHQNSRIPCFAFLA